MLICVEVSSQGEFILKGVSVTENTEGYLCNSTRPSKNKHCFLLLETDLTTTEKPAISNIYFLFSLVSQSMYQASRNLGKENLFRVDRKNLKTDTAAQHGGERRELLGIFQEYPTAVSNYFSTSL